MTISLDDRLDQVEATLAKISNEISITFPIDDELEAVRTEIFDAIKTQETILKQIERLLSIIEQRTS